MSSDELRASPVIKRKVDGIIADDEEAIAVLDQNIKKSKTYQDQPVPSLIGHQAGFPPLSRIFKESSKTGF
ncbi:hypothetical protein OS493_007264 [Desmophyllum pertusum]|uniref:Uncharacterized protein n=1 Tax=Desmophyllum pertusum TaxID=174260 RepID=A0A9W9Z2W4_9CNID|nr:hypothetical protein OS493_007264 [Desmophyllum pertusum]